MGRELIRLLRTKGHEVTLISRQPGPGKITWVRCQIISNHMCLYVFPLFLHEPPDLSCNSLFPQRDLESSGLPPCEGAVNLAGENLMNPLRW